MAVKWQLAITHWTRFMGGPNLAVRVLAVLGVVCVFSQTPLITDPGHFSTIVRGEPYLVLLDVFSGGSFARGSVLAVALCSYMGGCAMAFTAQSVLPRDLVSRRTATWTIVSALAIGPLYLMALRSSSAQTVPLALRLCDVASLSAGSALFLWLAEAVLPEFGVAFLVAMNVLAAIPGYLAAELQSAGASLFAVMTLAVALALQVVTHLSVRKVTVQNWWTQAPGQRRFSLSKPFAISLAPSGPFPILYALGAFAFIRCGTYVLQSPQTEWIRWLVALEDRLTDMHRPVFWLALFVTAVPVMTAYGYAVLNPTDLADELNISTAVVPGIRIGRNTAEYVFKAWTRIGWFGPTITMLTIVAPGLAYYMHSSHGLWPILLLAILCVSETQLRLLDQLIALRLTYATLNRKEAIRGRPS